MKRRRARLSRAVRGLQRRDRLGELAEAVGMVDGLTADEPQAPAILERQHAPAVVLLFVDPAGAVKRLTSHQGRGSLEVGRFYARSSQTLCMSMRLSGIIWKSFTCLPKTFCSLACSTIVTGESARIALTASS